MTNKQVYPLNRDAWDEWIDYRKEMKRPKYKTHSVQNTLCKLPPLNQQECIEASMVNEWIGLYPHKHKPQEVKKKQLFISVEDRGRQAGIEPRAGETWDAFEQRIKGIEQRAERGYIQ